MNVWKRLLGRQRLNRELDDEIRAHVRMATEDRIERGEKPADAERNAQREFGNRLLIAEVTRDMWGWTALLRQVQDLKYVFRQMGRSPGFTAVAILTLALGLGATTAMFSIVNGVLLEPLKFREPGRLYLARTLPPARSKLTGDFPVNARHFHEWRTHCRSCEQVSLIGFSDLTLIGTGEPQRLPAFRVSFNFFNTLGAHPALGRDFLPEEELPGHFAEVILTDGLWRSRFAGDPSIIGRTIQLNGESHAVVGVMPPDLHLPSGSQWGRFFGPAEAPLIFRPLGFNASQVSGNGSLNYTSVIRLKPGVRPEQAIAELNALQAELVRQFKLETKTTLIPLQDQVTRGARSALWLLLATVGAVLLIVCVNVGNLMLVRTTSRSREAGVRLALGASRAGLFGLVLKEALVLVAIGGGLGLFFAYAGLKMFVAAAPVGLPRLEEVGMDWRVLIFAGLVVAVSTIVCGLFPAWRLARIEPHESLKPGLTSTETGRKLRVREAMVSVEVALSTVLLIVGGLLMLSFFRLMRVEKGFDVTHVITQDVSFLSPKYARGFRRRFVEDLVAKLAQIPGVRYAAATNMLPLRGDDWTDGLRDPDHPDRPMENAAVANFYFTTPDYWKAMGIPLQRGRFLDASDSNLPRAVISARAAQYLWPNQNPIGKHVRGTGWPKPSLEVVGVVGEVRAGGLEREPPMMVYEHYWRMQPTGMSLVLRTQAHPTSIIAAMRAILSSADPEMAISQAKTMEQIVEATVADRKFQMYLAVAFAISALALASLGIYGVISFSVARRTPEMGIRIALGARGAQLVAMVVRQGMAPVVVGLAGGVIGALLVTRLIGSQLYGVAPNDPLTISAVAILLLAVAVCACWIPARRATRIDPLHALRFE
jgi:predicted permease